SGGLEEVVVVPDGGTEAAAVIRERLDGLVPSLVVEMAEGRSQGGLHERIRDTLFVILDSLGDLYPLAIEASIMTGSVLCARQGAAQEAFAGPGEARLFDARPDALARAIAERLGRPPA